MRHERSFTLAYHASCRIACDNIMTSIPTLESELHRALHAANAAIVKGAPYRLCPSVDRLEPFA
jgi:hypothetical protein